MFIGIDVAKAELVVGVRPSGETWSTPNSDRGVAQLVERVVALAPAHVVLEATGGYELLVAGALAAAGVPVAIVNPRQVRDFARATGQLAKTDQIDAAVLALFAERVQPAPRPVPEETAQDLDALVTRRRQLIEMLIAEKNRLGQLLGPSKRPVKKEPEDAHRVSRT